MAVKAGIDITAKIIALLKQAGIDYSKMAGTIDPNVVTKLVTKTEKTARKPKLIDALNKEKATYQQALDIFENDAKYLSQMNEMEQVNFANNLEDYFKVGGPIKYRPSNVVTPEGTPVEGKKLEALAKRKGAKEKPEATSLRGAVEGLGTLIDEIKGISPKIRNQMDRDELVKFIRKMRGRDFTNQEIKWVRDYMDEFSIGLAKEKAGGMQIGKKLGAKDKEEFEFVNEYLDDIQTTSPKDFREMHGNVKSVNMKLFDVIDKKLEKHFKKKYKWDDTKREGGLDDATFEKYEDELYDTQKEFGDFHRVYDTASPPNIWGNRKSTSWVNNPKEYLNEASEKLQSITGEGLNTNFWKNYTDEVLTKYPKPEKFQYGGIAGMLSERTGFQVGGAALDEYTPQIPAGGKLLPQGPQNPLSEAQKDSLFRSQIGNGFYDLQKERLNDPNYFQPLPSSPGGLPALNPQSRPENNIGPVGQLPSSPFTGGPERNYSMIPEEYRAGLAEYAKDKPWGFGGQAMSSVGLPGGGSVTFGETGSAGTFRDYLKSIGFTPPSPLGQPLPSSPAGGMQTPPESLPTVPPPPPGATPQPMPGDTSFGIMTAFPNLKNEFFPTPSEEQKITDPYQRSESYRRQQDTTPVTTPNEFINRGNPVARASGVQPGALKQALGLAGGGLAPLLGEPTYVDDNHRVPYKDGLQVLPADFDELDHDELMHIIKLLQAGEIPEFADGGRIGFSAGGIDKARRLFLQAMGAGAAGVGAAKTGLFGLFKGSKSTAVKNLTQVPIENAKGMPPWFKPLVNRVIKEGDDITNLPPIKGGAMNEREIVHSAKLGKGQGVRVTQDLDNKTITVEYQSADNMGGVDEGWARGYDDGIVRLEYKAAEEIEPILPQHMDPKDPKGFWKPHKDQKTEPTFSASEAYPVQDPKDYKYITFEGDNTVNEVKDLHSDISALKQFGTNKTLSKKELAIAKQKRERVKKINENPHEELAGTEYVPDYDDYASGGRVPLKGGKTVKGLAELMEQFFPGTTKVGKTSKPYPGKVQEKMGLRKAFADFQERQKGAKTLEAMSKAESKIAGPIKTQNKGFWDPESTDHTAFLLQKEFFRPDAKDFLGKKVPSNWIAIEREKAKNTLKELGPLPSRRHPEWEGMRRIRQGVKNRLVALDITEELGGNVAMFDYLRQVRGSPEKFLNIDDYIRKADAPVVKDELSGIKKDFVQKQAQKEGDPGWIKQGEAITEENFGTSQFAPSDDVIATRAYAGKVEELRREFPGISDDLIKNILADDNPQRIAEVKATLKEALKMQQKGMGPDEIINIFKKQGKKPTKHATGGLAGMLGE